MDHARRRHAGGHRLDPELGRLTDEVVTVRPGTGARLAAAWILLLLAGGVVMLAVAGNPSLLFLVLWVGWYPLLVACRSRVRVAGGELIVRNPILTYRFGAAEVGSLQVVSLSTNWNVRRPVHQAGGQRLRLLVIGGINRDVALVAADRFRWLPGIPPEYQEIADALGVPLHVRS